MTSGFTGNNSFSALYQPLAQANKYNLICTLLPFVELAFHPVTSCCYLMQLLQAPTCVEKQSIIMNMAMCIPIERAMCILASGLIEFLHSISLAYNMALDFSTLALLCINL